MKDNENYNKIANKLANIDDKFIEIESIIKMLNIWIKENNYELIPIMNILNNKINDLVQILRK